MDRFWIRTWSSGRLEDILTSICSTDTGVAEHLDEDVVVKGE
jgi:hypothetical protein